MKAKYLGRVDQSRNGVRVIVHRWTDGSTVEADCQCFGGAFRSHSTSDCPMFRKAIRESQ